MANKNEKRRDSKGRILRTGESQREDGRYRFKYMDGKEEKNVYSWKLEPKDKLPPGKRDCISLREMEKKIRADKEDGIITDGAGLTVIQLCERYIATKTGVSHNTEAGYKTVMNTLKKHKFGQMRIDKVTQLAAKEYLIYLNTVEKKRYSTVHTIRGVLRPAFKMALDNDFIRKNPFDFPLVDVMANDSVRRDAITKDQERRFLKFIQEDPYFSMYYDAVFILFNTGLRISEFCGLTLKDINLEDKTLSVNHQLQRKRDGQLYIVEQNKTAATTKTPAGTRVIPITDEVCQAFDRIIKNRKLSKKEVVIDGFTGFLMYTEWNSVFRPMVAMDWEHKFKRMVEKYNSIYKNELPPITPHVCRHTYCSNRAKEGMNPKTLQFLMGHSDISVTMDTYTHINIDDAKNEMKRLQSQVVN